MAAPFRKNGRWYLRYKDAQGRWRQVPSEADTKTNARRLAVDLQRREERIRLGVEVAPPENGGGTVDQLISWWIETYLAKSAGFGRAVGTIRKHLIGSKIASLRLVEVTPGKIEAFLQAKVDQCSPQTLNHLRGYLSRAFNAARTTDHFRGPNPVADVKKRKVPKRVPDYLRAEEVTACPRRTSPIAGVPLRDGALHRHAQGRAFRPPKTDVDLRRRLLTVAHSYDRETTKGGHADVIPIASGAGRLSGRSHRAIAVGAGLPRAGRLDDAGQRAARVRPAPGPPIAPASSRRATTSAAARAVATSRSRPGRHPAPVSHAAT